MWSEPDFYDEHDEHEQSRASISSIASSSPAFRAPSIPFPQRALRQSRSTSYLRAEHTSGSISPSGSGLDLSAPRGKERLYRSDTPPTPTVYLYSPDDDVAQTSVMSALDAQYTPADEQLNHELAALRVSPGSGGEAYAPYSSGILDDRPSQDEGDAAASARANIAQLAARGQATTGGDGHGTPRSLANFMGASGAVRLGKVGTGATEDEREASDKLEQEMAQVRARFAGNGSAGASAGGPLRSLADFMRGGAGSSAEEEEEVRAHARKERVAMPGLVATPPVVSPGLEAIGSPPLSAKPPSTAEAASSSRPAHARKRSAVVERWGRDEPDATPPASPRKVPQSAARAATLPGETSKALSSPAQPTRGWSGPPIGVKETAKSPTKEQPIERKYSRGIALPGLSRPEVVSPTPAVAAEDRSTSPTGPSISHRISTYSVVSAGEGKPPNVTSTALSPPADDIQASPLPSPVGRPEPSKDVKAEPARPTTPVKTGGLPRSPSGNVRSAIASWGTPAGSGSATDSSTTRESYGVRKGAKRQSLDLSKWQERVQGSSSPEKPVSRSRISSRNLDPVAASAAAAEPAPSLVAPDPPVRSPSPLEEEATQVQKSSVTVPAGNAGFVPYIRPLLAPPPSATATIGKPTSVDVFVVTASGAQPLKAFDGIVYESELLAFVAQTADKRRHVFGWRGQDVIDDDAMATHLEQLAKEHGLASSPAAVTIAQGRETGDFMRVVGGQLITRRDAREYFDASEAKMYTVRRELAGLFIDEVSKAARSLCSGYVSIITGETVRLWQGMGSSDEERSAAMAFAKSLAGSVEVVEEGKESASFWRSFDDREYASANHWRYRRNGALPPSLIACGKEGVKRVDMLTETDVTVIDVGYELYIVVPPAARANVDDIATALSVVLEFASLWRSREPALPFPPAAHVIIFPSIVPRDLLAAARGIDFSFMNEEGTPAKMNLVPFSQARDLLSSSRSISADKLDDSSCLPLGVAPQ